MSSRRRRRRWGMVAALSVSLTTVLVVAAIVIQTSMEAAEPPIPIEEDELPDVRAGARGGDGLFVQFVDPEDPTRVTGEMEAKSVDPDPAGPRRSVMDEPIVWLFPDDGTVMHVRADQGRFFLPSRNQEPESGTLEGNVIVRVFEPLPGGRRPVLGEDDPAFDLRTPRLEFDTTIGQAETESGWMLEGTKARGEGRRFLARFNEGTEQLVRLETEGGLDGGEEGWLAFFVGNAEPEDDAPPAEESDPGTPTAEAPPARMSSGPPNGGGDASGASAEPPPPVPPDADTPVETIYQVTFERNARVEHGSMWITSDHLRLWARLIDNELPEGAIGGVDRRASRAAPANPVAIGRPLWTTGYGLAGPPPAWWSLPPFDVSEAPDAPEKLPTPAGDENEAVEGEASPDDDWVTIRYEGQMLVHPLADAPPELEEDHVAVRFWSEPGRVVRFGDPAAEARGHMPEVRYQATTRRVQLHPSESVPTGQLVMENAGTARFERCEFDWANGLAHLPGPGEAYGTDGQEIRWTKQGDLVFRMVDGTMARELEQARFQGDTVASRGEAALRGEFMRVDFGLTDEGESFPSRLYLEGRQGSPARAANNPEEFLEGDVIDAVLVPGPRSGEVDPTSVTVTGNVRGVQHDARLTAGELDARLERNAEQDLVVTEAFATGGCTFVRTDDDVRAEAESIFAQPEQNKAVLIGERAMVSMRPTRVYGREIELDGSRQAISVNGPGLFDDTGGSGSIATWTSEMHYDDSAGRLECVGDVSALVRPDPWTRDRLRGERLEARLTREGEDGGALVSADDDVLPGAEGERRIEWARLVGESEAEGAPAQVESVRFATPAEDAAKGGDAAVEEQAPEDPAALVAQLTGGVVQMAGQEGTEPDEAEEKDEPEPIRTSMLEGGIIELDNVAGTLTVPTAGQLVHSDLTSREKETAEGLVAQMSGGQAWFTFEESLHADRRAETADLHGDVKITHRKWSEDGEVVVTLLDAEHVRARFAESEDAAAGGGRLRAARATGSVYAATKRGSIMTQEVIADVMDYDLDAGTAEAWAEGDRWVRFYDATRAAPATAKRIFWDMMRGRMEVRSAGPVVAPR